MIKNLIISLLAVVFITSCTDDQPTYSASELDGYCHELYQMYDKKNQMLLLMGNKKSEIERDQQAQLAFIHEELNADSNSCHDFLKEQMQDFFGN